MSHHGLLSILGISWRSLITRKVIKKLSSNARKNERWIWLKNRLDGNDNFRYIFVKKISKYKFLSPSLPSLRKGTCQQSFSSCIIFQTYNFIFELIVWVIISRVFDISPFLHNFTTFHELFMELCKVAVKPPWFSSHQLLDEMLMMAKCVDAENFQVSPETLLHFRDLLHSFSDTPEML